MGKSTVSDVVIAGGGIVGLSLGIELRRRGLSVLVLERDQAMRGASWAAGGMLAAHDPKNPQSLTNLSLHSLALYPAYLEGVVAASGLPVPLRTSRALQCIEDGEDGAAEEAALQEARNWVPGLRDAGQKFAWLEEQSFDPRDLCRALPAAFQAVQGILMENTPLLALETSGSGVVVRTARERIHAATFINCCGAWAGEQRLGGLPVEPVKGQMVTVKLTPDRLRCVLRGPGFYAIPRGDGRVTIGATLEHVGFDQTVEERSIATLLQRAAELLPEINGAVRLESWAGFRPGTPDGLPILGASTQSGNCWHATGHYRNGVLLAPGTARVMAQRILGEPTDVGLEDFSPARF